MAAIMSPASADAALAQGLITPTQHAEITGMSAASTPGPATIAPFLPPPEPAPPPPPGPPPAELARAFGDAGLRLDAPPPPPAGPKEITSPEEMRTALAGGGQMVNGTTNGALPERPLVGVAGGEPPPSPRGEMQIGRITSAPAMAAPVARSPGPGAPPAGKDPRVLGYERDVALGDRESASAVRQGNEAVAQAQESYAAQKAAQDAVDRQATIDAAAKVKEQADIDRQVQSTHAAVDDYSTQKIDPDRYWKNQSTGQKLIGFLGMAVGGFLEGFTNGAVKNPMMGAVNRAIDADLHAQEVDLETKGKGVQQRRGMLADMIAITGSKEAGRAAAKVAAFQNLHQQLDTVAAKHAANVAPEKVEQVRIGIDAHLSDAKTKLDVMLKAEKQAAAAQGQAAAAHAAAAAAARDKELFGRGVELSKLKLERDKIDKEKGGTATTAEADAAFRQDKAALDLAWKNSVSTNYGSRPAAAVGNIFATDNNSVNTGAVSQLVGAVKGQGDNSDKDLERLKTMVPQAGDDESTLNKKYGMLMAKLSTKHPGAAERNLKGGVQTTAAPGRK